MLREVNLDGGDLGRGRSLLPEDIDLVFSIIGEIIDYLPKDKDWAWAFEVSDGPENIDDLIRSVASKYKLNLYNVNGMILFRIASKSGGKLHKSIFYILKRKS